MSPDGAEMHSALASLTLNDPGSWPALQADLKRIITTNGSDVSAFSGRWRSVAARDRPAPAQGV